MVPFVLLDPLIASYDEDLKKPELFMIQPSGLCYKYFGCAAGSGAQAGKTELEKILNKAEYDKITSRSCQPFSIDVRQ